MNSLEENDNVSFELKGHADNSRFLVSNRLEILRVMRGLAGRNELVSAFFSSGKELLLTAVLTVDADRDCVLLDFSSNEELNQHILASSRIIFVTSLDRVKIQWVSEHITQAGFEGRSAFQIALPQQILRLQRREYYRLTTPIAHPIKCLVPIGADSGTKWLEFPLTDIGAGGIGVVIGGPATETELKPGEAYPGCRIELPDIGTVEATLQVQNIFEVTLKNGNKNLHCGCQFVNLRPAMQAMIQRYIIRLERDRISTQ